MLVTLAMDYLEALTVAMEQVVDSLEDPWSWKGNRFRKVNESNHLES